MPICHDHACDCITLDDFDIMEIIEHIEERTNKTISFDPPLKSLLDVQLDELFEEAKSKYSLFELQERLR